MVEIRPLRPEELGEATRLADETFRDAEQKSMAEGFPHVFSQSLTSQSYGAFDEGKLVTFLGLVPSVIRVGESRLNVYSLGSVCTHPDYRGKGYASAVLERVLAHVDRAGAALLLVTGTRSLYTRANCHLFGDVTRFVLKPDEADAFIQYRSAKEVHIRELEGTDWLKLSELASARETRYEQSVWDLATLVHAEPYASCIRLYHKVLVAEKDGELQGFLVFGVPYRLGLKWPPTAFEWAGDAEIVAVLLATAVRRFNLERLDVPVGWHERKLAELLSGSESAKEKNLGTVNIVDPERLIRQLRPYVKRRNAELNRQFSVTSLGDGQVGVRLGEKKAVFDTRQFVSLVFDPEPDIEVNGPLASSLKQFFPIPFPYTGGLNYV